MPASNLRRTTRFNVFRSARKLAWVSGALWVIGCIGYVVLEEPGASMTYAIGWPDDPAGKVESCEREDSTRDISVRAGKGQNMSVTLCFRAQKAGSGRWLVPYVGTALTSADELVAWMNDNKAKLGGAEADALVREYLEARMTSRGLDSSMARHGAGLVSEKWGPLHAARQDAERQGDAERARKLAQELAALTAIRFSTRERHSTEFNLYADAVAERFAFPADDLKEVDQRLWDARVKQWKDAAQVLAGGLLIGWLLVLCIGWIARGIMGIPRGQDSARVRRQRAKP